MRNKILSWLGATYLRLVAVTSRVEYRDRAIRDEMEEKYPGFIYAFWHGRQVFLPYLHRGDRIRPLISQSRDGEIIAQVCARFGLKVVRGSSSRGGTEALREILQVLESRERVGFTPDGPRGPLHSVALGAIYTAQKAGCPIVPVAYGARRAWVFGSWDQFIMPQPFNKIVMMYGSPIFIGAKDDIPQKAQQLRDALNEVTRRADEAAGARLG